MPVIFHRLKGSLDGCDAQRGRSEMEAAQRQVQDPLCAKANRWNRCLVANEWSRARKVYPEVEYIEYDVEEMKEPCFIEPHVDNKSAATWPAEATRGPWPYY